MSFFPASVDPRSDVLGMLTLVNVNTEEGDFGFIVGADGVFTDVNDKTWYGSTLISDEGGEFAIGGTIPTGSLTLSYVQDPSQPDVVAELLSLGVSYVEDRPITFYKQPILSHQEFAAPTVAPILFRTRTARKIIFNLDGHLVRRITLTYETVFERIRNRRGRVLNVEDHSALAGSENPSLTYIPTQYTPDQKFLG